MSEEELSSVHTELLNYVKKLRFKKRLFGGVDPDDVLRKLEELNRLYEAALLAERARYDALLNERR